MKRIAGFAAIALLAVVNSAGAQERPNFSGRWTLEEPAAPTTPPQPARGGGGGRGGARAGSMGSGWSTPITITQDANKLTVEYAFSAVVTCSRR